MRLQQTSEVVPAKIRSLKLSGSVPKRRAGHREGPWTECAEPILLQRLQTSYGINGSALQWFRSYLVGRTQRVRRGATMSSAVHLVCGVPQGSVIGLILFVLYTADLIALIKSYGLSPHLYADDTQIYGSCSPSHVDMFLSVVTDCANAAADWMRSNRLQLNSDKTEFIVVCNGPSPALSTHRWSANRIIYCDAIFGGS